MTRPAEFKQRLTGVMVMSILLVVGLGFLVTAGVVYATTTSFLAGAERTTGTVVGLVERPAGATEERHRTVWAPEVRFAVDGRTIEFRGNVGSSPPAYEVGDSVQVAYDPADPSDARIVGFTDLYLLPLIFGLVGAVLTGASATASLLWWRRRRRRAWLRQYGQPVEAEITAVTRAGNYRVNGRSPYVIHATWHDLLSGEKHAVRSEHLWSDPRPALDVGHHVRVLVDPARPQRHLMELPGHSR
jgi:hypothetical protein